jgi:hypothetical protein
MGGLLSAGTAYSLERVRRRNQRRDKLDDARREALARALAWIDPMEKAINGAEIEIYALLHSRKNDDEFRQAFPNLLSDLARLDLSLQHRLVLDFDPYPLGNDIRQAFEELKQHSLSRWEKTQYPQDSPVLSISDASYECSLAIEGIRERIDALRRQLAKEYKNTYE